jgi:hypothetical protein
MNCNWAHAPCSMIRTRGAACTRVRSVAIEQRETSAIGRPLCTTDRCSDIFKDPLQPRTFNLKQRAIEEAGYAIAVLRSRDLRKVVVVRAGHQPQFLRRAGGSK